MSEVTRATQRGGISSPLSMLSGRNLTLLVFSIAVVLYLVGVWLHYPYGGGYIYSDLITVFLSRECNWSSACHPGVPYIQTFVEYPVLVAMFMYAMAVMGSLIPGSLLINYYYFTVVFLAIPTFLIIRELLLLARIRETSKSRVLWYFVITPTFLYMVLLNWYVIGVYFAVSGMRRYLEGGRSLSGVFFGLSAASNLVTAVPALGLLISMRTMSERVRFAGAALGVYLLINAPVIILNQKLWFESYNYVYNWGIEDSWLYLILRDVFSPLRHYIPLAIFGAVLAVMIWFRFRRGVVDPLQFAFISMFAYVFSSYIYTPQLNVTLLPFFVLLPIVNTYWEFLEFDAANALIIILGFSQALLPLGISYSFDAFARASLVWWIMVIRSLWVGKFAIFDGLFGMLAPAWRKKGTKRSQEIRPAHQPSLDLRTEPSGRSD